MAVTVNNSNEGTVARVSVLEERVKAIAEIANERDRRYEDRFRLGDEKIVIALNSSEKAVSKAEGATEKRFDSVNEFRSSLKDQAGLMLTRSEADVKFKAIDDSIISLVKSRSDAEGANRTLIYIVGFVLTALIALLRFWK